MNNKSRRKFLGQSIGLSLAVASKDLWAGSEPGMPNLKKMKAYDSYSTDEKYWNEISSLYDISRDFVQLENAYFGMMSRPVAEEYKKNVEYVNRYNSLYLRTNYDITGLDSIRSLIATNVNASREEIAITRGATEALQNLITNYNLLKPGDAVMFADLDYNCTQYAMNFLKERRSVDVIVVNIPEPATKYSLIEFYRKKLEENKNVKLLLLTHVSHRTGLVIPVKEICAIARERKVDVIVDVAHSWGQIDFNVSDLGADFIGFNLHKWMGAPLGVGFMYIKKERIKDISPVFHDEDYDQDDIRARVHTGTTNTANVMTIPAAFAFHNEIGIENKRNRLVYLRDYWVNRLKELNEFQILTPDDSECYGAITSFRLKGCADKKYNVKVVNELLSKYSILTCERGGMASGSCIRVTPSLYTSPKDLDKFIEAMKIIVS